MNLASIPMPWLAAALCLLIGLVFDETASHASDSGRKTVYSIASALGFIGALFFTYIWIAL